MASSTTEAMTTTQPMKNVVLLLLKYQRNRQILLDFEGVETEPKLEIGQVSVDLNYFLRKTLRTKLN